MARTASTAPDSGNRNRPAQIFAPAAYLDDGQGGNANAGQYVLVRSPMIHLSSGKNGRGSKWTWKYGQRFPEAEFWADMRYCASVVINATMILEHRGRRYQILGAINDDERNVDILLPLLELNAAGTKTT